MDIVGVIVVSLHVAATVVLLGHYVLMRLVDLPVAERQLRAPSVGPMLEATERRALPWLAAALAVLVATGGYLLVTSPRFTGFGQLASTWSVLLFVKHVLILAIVGIVAVFDLVLLGDLSAAVDDSRRTSAMRRVRWALDALVLLGAAVIVLTAAAQASP